MGTDDLFPTHRSLLSRLKDWDDQESWRDFFDTYWRLIYSTARRAGLSEGDAEDVVQETVVAVAKKIGDFEYDPATCSFKTWLRVVTQRRIADQFRKKARRVATVDLPARDDTATAPVDALPDPASIEPDPRWEEDWEQNLLRAAYERVKRQVKAKTFQVYDYHVIQGQPVGKTCRAMGVNPAQVYLAKLRVGERVKREIAELRHKSI